MDWLTQLLGLGAAGGIPAGTAPMPTIEQMTGVSGGIGGAGAPMSVWDPQASAPPGTPGATQQGGLASALRGIAAPQVPAAQRLSTPSAPRMADIKGGELLQLLLMQGGGEVPGGRKINPLPGTLGQALNVPRY